MNFLANKYKNQSFAGMSASDDITVKYKNLINLSIGDPDIITPSVIINGAFHDAEDGYTKYTEPAGLPELISEICNAYKEDYDMNVNHNEVMATVGACHGMYLVLQSIIDNGDEVIIVEPYFNPYKQQVEMAGGVPVFVPTFEEDNFVIREEVLEKYINEKTKAIIINYPNNPTGAVYDEDTLEKIAGIVEKHNLVVISDEVYDSFSYDVPFIPFSKIKNMKERTITLGSFSKSYCMTGWRIGYVIAPDYIINCVKNVNEGICYTAPSISQRAAIKALKERKTIRTEIVDTFKERIEYVYNRINEIKNLSVKCKEGSLYLFMNIKETGLSSKEYGSKILEAAEVLLLPGDLFGDSGEGYMRIACTQNLDVLKEAFDRIESFHNNHEFSIIK